MRSAIAYHQTLLELGMLKTIIYYPDIRLSDNKLSGYLSGYQYGVVSVK